MDGNMIGRIMLYILQVFTVIIALVFSANPWDWLNWLPSSIGLGACYDKNGDDHTCYSNGMINRTECVGFFVFVVLLILSVSGCVPKSALASIPAIVCIVVVPFILVFFPNSVFEIFAQFALVASAVFLILQTLVLVDFAQTMNDAIFGTGLSARRVSINIDHSRTAKIVLVSMSALLLCGALAGAIVLWISFTNTWVVTCAFVISLVLLGVSITEWCTNGNLFASSLVMLYSIWLSYEVLITESGDAADKPVFFKWVGLIIALLILAASVFGSALGLGIRDESLMDSSQDGPDSTAFATQSVIHALATLYVATALAPVESSAGFISRVVALFASLLLYLWVLVAPQLFPDRF